MEVPWTVSRGVNQQGQSMIAILAEGQVVWMSGEENPALFNHIAYAHNKLINVEVEDAECSE